LLRPEVLKILLMKTLMAASHITSRFGASVRSLRYRLGISQEVLAERAGLHRTYIAGIEGGTRNVTLKSLDKLARALQVTPATLLLQLSDPPTKEEPSSDGDYAEILVAEGNRDDEEFILHAFKHARVPHSIRVVRDGQEVLDFLFRTGRHARRDAAPRPKVILLSLKLAKMNGLKVLRRLKADLRTRTIPVVVLTSSQAESDVLECYMAGVNSYAVKPKDFDTFIQLAQMIAQYWLRFNHTVDS
jgi:two-component system, response regulator